MADDTLSTFVAEAEEYLDKFNQVLIELEEKKFDDEELVSEFLRDLHSLKGISNMVGMTTFGTIVHTLESLVGQITSGEEELTPVLMELLFEIVDDLKATVENVVDEGDFVNPSFLEILLDKMSLFVDIPDEDSSQEGVLDEQGSEQHIQDPTGSHELENLDYRELQSLAKDLGIKANKTTEELIEAIGEKSAAPEIESSPAPEEEESREVEKHPGEEQESGVDEEAEFMYEPWDPNEYGELVVDFLEEAQEMLELVTNEMIKLEKNSEDEEVIDAIFRAAHTLKGSSGMIKLTALETIAHNMEELFDEVREGERDVTPELIDLLLVSSDKIEKIISLANRMEPVQVKIKHVLGALKDFKEGKDVDIAAVRQLEENAQAQRKKEEQEDDEDSKEKDSSDSGSAKRKVRASIRVDIEKLDTVINQVGELVINKGRLDQKIDDLKKLQTVINSLVDTIQRHCERQEDPENKYISKDADRISRVFQELSEETEQSSRDISRLISDLQESVMRTRMVPIAQLFNKYPRMVRDLCRAKDKEINLTIEGKDTELDKTVIEKIGDPLMHIIRNAVDHGIGGPEERKDAGKPSEGQLTISAGYEGDLIVIKIEDDGRGINVEKVKKSAIEKGVISEEEAEELTPDEMRKLIFKPGFSTAKEVTETSGRGVGMDVVMDNLRNLSGTIDLKSVEGEGTIFTIKLPLTLAIIQVLIVNIGEKKYALPLSAVRETIRIEQGEINKIGQKEVFDLRENTISLLRLNQVLGYSDSSAWHQDSYPVVVAQSGERQVGILVDTLVEKQEIVIKDLGSILNNVRFASGATIMGDGSVIIIIDIAEVIHQIDQLQASAPVQKTAAPVVSEVEEGIVKPKILVVEDDKTTINMLADTLKESGYEVEKAVNGKEAYETCQQEEYDLISTDIEMPEMNGYEFVKKVRELENFKETPIIMVSSLGEKTDKVRGFDVGVDDYLEKPFGRTEYLRKIKDFI